jgi:hypothetical protein
VTDDAARRAKRKGLLVRLTVAPLLLVAVLALLWWHAHAGTSTGTDVVLVLFSAGAAYEAAAMLAKASRRGPSGRITVIASIQASSHSMRLNIQTSCIASSRVSGSSHVRSAVNCGCHGRPSRGSRPIRRRSRRGRFGHGARS